MESTLKQDYKITGQPGAPGIAVGEVYGFRPKLRSVEYKTIEPTEVKKHLNSFKKARGKLLEEYDQLNSALDDIDSREILDTHRQIAEDPEIEKKVYLLIEEELNACDYAVFHVFGEFIERLKESGSELFKQRITDLEDIRDRLIRIIINSPETQKSLKNKILFTSELSPADLLSFYDQGIKGLVMEKGGVTSHSAIIAKSLGIPCIVSVKNLMTEIEEANVALLHGSEGVVILNPSNRTVSRYRNQKRKTKTASHISANDVSTDGVAFKLLANLEFEDEIKKIAPYNVSGIGLLRTEAMLYRSSRPPEVEEQADFYNKVMNKTEGPVTIRLYDAGGDKVGLRAKKEANPFLGLRGIRLLLKEEKILYNQLKAILITSTKYEGRLRIMVPMASTIEEMDHVRSVLNKIKKELKADGTVFDEQIPVGMMIEVPAAILCISQFQERADFFSLGTNDLTQYIFAADRGNEEVAELYQQLHPAVLKMIQMTVDGIKKDTEISVCGELGGNPAGAAIMMGMGIRTFSMVASQIPEVREVLQSFSVQDFENLSEQALKMKSAHEVKELFNKWKEEYGT